MNHVPDTALSNVDIEKYVKLLGIKYFRGCYMRNELLRIKPWEVECGVLNLNLANQPGSHWVCWYKNQNKKYYFNSFGLPPPTELVNYLGSPILYSTFQLQGLENKNCGKWCLRALEKLSDGQDFVKCILSFVK